MAIRASRSSHDTKLKYGWYDMVYFVHTEDNLLVDRWVFYKTTGLDMPNSQVGPDNMNMDGWQVIIKQVITGD